MRRQSNYTSRRAVPPLRSRRGDPFRVVKLTLLALGVLLLLSAVLLPFTASGGAGAPSAAMGGAFSGGDTGKAQGHGVASVQRDHMLRMREAKRQEAEHRDQQQQKQEEEDEYVEPPPKRIKASPDSGLGFGPGDGEEEDGKGVMDAAPDAAAEGGGDLASPDGVGNRGAAHREDEDARRERIARMAESGKEHHLTAEEFEEHLRNERNKAEGGGRDFGPLARGIAGLPSSETPALIGASRGHIECDVDVDALAYWNDPQGDRDRNYQSAFFDEVAPGTDAPTKYISFQPDSGGWNNIRMSMENMFVFAAALGRTLVLPPPQPMYLLKADKEEKMRGFADFYPLQTEAFRRKVKVISMEEFLMREGGESGKLAIPAAEREAQKKRAEGCIHMKKSDIFCDALYDHLKSVGYVPELGGKSCAIFDEDKFHGKEMVQANLEKVKEFCGEERTPFFVSSEMQDSFLIHFRTSDKGYRMVNHFYGYLLFTDPVVDNYYKRFVRDFLHYRDSIYCAAGKIVKAVQEEGRGTGIAIDEEGGGGFSSLHVRRGDLQYKKVKISAQRWHDNTKDLWETGEMLYIATDERNKTFFDPIKKHHPVRFLDDYWELAGLGDLDPNYMGMIDTIVASRGRNFAGTYFSTFSGYITRMRGYYGMSAKTSYYGLEKYKYAMHTWHQGPKHIFSHEWPTGWIGIDGDSIPSQEIF